MPNQGETAFYWLAMGRARGVSVRKWHLLLRAFDTAEAVFTAEPSALAALGLDADAVKSLKNPDRRGIDADLKWLANPNHNLLTWDDDKYPRLLRQIHDPPLALFVQGDADLLDSTQISIIGSRNPSPDGRRNAREFAGNLARCGFTITSGLAVGLDTCAHLGALDASGRTIAVLGSGLDVIYPACNRSLAEQLTQNGALVSEYPPGTRPMAINFPRRNRIISGLSMGTLVVEATLSSGSLITASLALEQGREVFAIPGSIHNPLSQGCHRLIRDGAKLVEIVDDILEEISPIQSAFIPPRCVRPRSGNIPEGLDADSKLLLHNIGMQPVGVDTLVQETGLTAGVITASLLILELGGFVEQQPGGEYRRCNVRE